MKLTLQNFGLPVTLIFILSFCLFGCSSDEEVRPGSTLFPAGAELESVIAQAIDADSLQERGKSGEELFYAPNQETPYTGWVKRFHDDEEQIYILFQIHNGKSHGAFTRWYENGQKEAEGIYKDGERDGKWTEWHSNGQKEVEGTYKDGERDGTATIWHSNGQKAAEGTFKEDVQDGAWTFWHSNGQKGAEGTYAVVEIVLEEDTLFEAVQVGKWAFWYENGQKAAEGTFKEGQRDANWLYWSEGGEQISEWSFNWFDFLYILNP